MTESSRMKILEMIESGKITASEGLRLLEALPEDTTELVESEISPSEEPVILEEEDLVVEDEPLKPAGVSESVFSADPLEDESPQAEAFETGATTQPEADFTAEEPAATPFSAEPEVEMPEPNESIPPDLDKWRQYWVIPLSIGIVITVLAGAFMYWAFAGQHPFWFVCSWLPFLLGVAVIALGYGSRKAKWLHVRVDQGPGERPRHIAISFPLPIGLASWGLRNFGHYIPDIQDKQIDKILDAVAQNTGPENPFYVEVDEGNNGEKVKVYIG